LGTHVVEIDAFGGILDVLFPVGPPPPLVGFDRRRSRVQVPLGDVKSFKLKVSSPDYDVQEVYDHAEWWAIREEVFTSSTFFRVPTE
jgi:hypothetical protein